MRLQVLLSADKRLHHVERVGNQNGQKSDWCKYFSYLLLRGHYCFVHISLRATLRASLRVLMCAFIAFIPVDYAILDTARVTFLILIRWFIKTSLFDVGLLSVKYVALFLYRITLIIEIRLELCLLIEETYYLNFTFDLCSILSISFLATDCLDKL